MDNLTRNTVRFLRPALTKSIFYLLRLIRLIFKCIKYLLLFVFAYLLLGVLFMLGQIAYYYCTSPSWGELSSLISPDEIIIQEASHRKIAGYEQEFEIYIPNKNSRAHFISSIESIGNASLLDTWYYKGQKHYYFPMARIGMAVMVEEKEKEGCYSVHCHYMPGWKDHTNCEKE